MRRAVVVDWCQDAMTISQIYQNYQIMPNLELHMLRVSGVALLIAENTEPATLLSPLEKDEIVQTCLLHDMANILKFDLEKFPGFLAPNGLEYWQNVQKSFAEKYGSSEHEAVQVIANELDVSTRVKELIASINFNKAEENATSADFARKICAYADMRVTPFGVVSLTERLDDLEERYGHKYAEPEQKARRLAYREFLGQIETQIFAKSRLRTEEITDATVEEKFVQLRAWVISAKGQ